MKRMVYGVSDWPEEGQELFAITEVRDDESDEEAMLRAKSFYDNELEVRIEEVEE